MKPNTPTTPTITAPCPEANRLRAEWYQAAKRGLLQHIIRTRAAYSAHVHGCPQCQARISADNEQAAHADIDRLWETEDGVEY